MLTVPPTDAPTPSAADAPPSSEDGWPGGLPALRAELDRIDDTLHDLLMQRARVVEHVARSGKASAFRPGREASIVRRLIGRHQGKLPAQAIFRIWREMLAGTTGMQAPVIVAVCDTDPGAQLTQVAREHFGALTPVHVHGSPARALAELSARTASVAVLPYPSETAAWWTTLLHAEPRMHIIAKLPFWGIRPESTPTVQAVVVAAAAPDASGHDRSFIGLELGQETSRTRVSSVLTAAGLPPASMVLRPDHALVEVDGYVPEDDARLAAIQSLGRGVVVGCYAVPVNGASA